MKQKEFKFNYEAHKKAVQRANEHLKKIGVLKPVPIYE